MIKKIEFLEEFSKELLKMMYVIGSLLLITVMAGFIGYGFLHYAQGITLMSSPILLMQSYLVTGIFTTLITLWFIDSYKSLKKSLKKGEY